MTNGAAPSAETTAPKSPEMTSTAKSTSTEMASPTTEAATHVAATTAPAMSAESQRIGRYPGEADYGRCRERDHRFPHHDVVSFPVVAHPRIGDPLVG
jgi:hypothetical protein